MILEVSVGSNMKQNLNKASHNFLNNIFWIEINFWVPVNAAHTLFKSADGDKREQMSPITSFGANSVDFKSE